MNCRSACEDPPSQLARTVQARAISFTVSRVDPRDPAVQATLTSWLDEIPILQRRYPSPATRTRLGDVKNICGELARVLAGLEPGEGRCADRTVHVAVARGRVQGVASMFACVGGTFVELLTAAPWNVLGAEDPPDLRTIRGTGTALIDMAVQWGRRRGCGGQVALQAENARALAFYERHGFRRLRPEDRPLSLVPPGEEGWSPEILRVAGKRPGPAEARSPWLLLDADEQEVRVAARAPARSSSGALAAEPRAYADRMRLSV